MNVYLAARYGRRAELLRYAAELETMGHTITSRWIYGEHEAKGGTDDGATLNGMTLDECREYAIEDLMGVDRADAFICFSESEGSAYSRGGRHVELGYAIGVGCHIVVIGPRENIFHTLGELWHYESWDAFKAGIGREGW